MRDKVTALGTDYLGRTSEHNDLGRRALVSALAAVFIFCLSLFVLVGLESATSASVRVLVIYLALAVGMATYSYRTGLRGYLASRRNLATNGRLCLVAVVMGPLAAFAVFFVLMALRLQSIG